MKKIGNKFFTDISDNKLNTYKYNISNYDLSEIIDSVYSEVFTNEYSFLKKSSITSFNKILKNKIFVFAVNKLFLNEMIDINTVSSDNNHLSINNSLISIIDCVFPECISLLNVNEYKSNKLTFDSSYFVFIRISNNFTNFLKHNTSLEILRDLSLIKSILLEKISVVDIVGYLEKKQLLSLLNQCNIIPSKITIDNKFLTTSPMFSIADKHLLDIQLLVSEFTDNSKSSIIEDNNYCDNLPIDNSIITSVDLSLSRTEDTKTNITETENIIINDICNDGEDHTIIDNNKLDNSIESNIVYTNENQDDNTNNSLDSDINIDGNTSIPLEIDLDNDDENIEMSLPSSDDNIELNSLSRSSSSSIKDKNNESTCFLKLFRGFK